MSLLMQALKKAEQTKQKQQSEAVLSLSPTDNHPAEDAARDMAQDAAVIPTDDTTEFLALNKQLNENADDGVNNNNTNNATSLSLSLTQQESNTHIIEDIPSLTPTPHAESTNQAAYALAAQHEPFLADTERLMPAANKSQQAHPADAMLDVTTSKAMPKSDSVPSMADKLHRPRIDPEQLRANAKAGASLAAEQKKAQSVFSSKTLAQPSRKNWLIALGGVGLLMAAGFAYVYWQNKQFENRPGLLGSAANTAPNPIPEPNAAVDASVGASTSDNANNVPVIASAAASATPNKTDAATIAVNGTATASNQKQGQDTSDKTAPLGKIRADKAPDPVDRSATTSSGKLTRNTALKANNLPSHLVSDANAIQIRKGNSGNQINPTLSSAYQAFITGDTATAERQYQSVLVQEPYNRDALFGLAALALNQKDADKSGSFYGRLLELDPNDPDAIAGLTSLQQGDPAQSESRLKKALSMHPNAGAIMFALGNLYAQQARWSEAQQYYFRAYTTQSNNADYAFNLAVSLDRLNQSKLAKDYYQRALDSGQAGTGNFNRSKVQQRIADLDKALHE
ncbi:tetratricopeptide repeat protein [Undibacterium danionis]|uniref:Tetratricopeptide repeat protein n=1 Tax=Undibacterium danionis TaxID=1812100 RepID=A0ABV6IEY9_9BURK